MTQKLQKSQWGENLVYEQLLVQPELTWGVTAGVGRQLLPNISGPDGLFYALIEKRQLL